MTAASTLTAPAGVTTTTERAIIAAADDLFTLHGVVPVGLQQVADLADVPLEAVEYAFPDRQDLVAAALRHRHRLWFDALAQATSGVDDPREELLAVFAFLETTFGDVAYRGCAFVNGYGELGRHDARIARLADEHLSEIERHIALMCARAGLPGYVCDAVTLLVQGAQVEAAIHRTTAPARSARLAVATLIAVYDDHDGWV